MAYAGRKRCALTTGVVIGHLLLLSGAQLRYIGVIQDIYYGNLAVSLTDPFLDRRIYNLTHIIKFLLKTDHLFTSPNLPNGHFSPGALYRYNISIINHFGITSIFENSMTLYDICGFIFREFQLAYHYLIMNNGIGYSILFCSIPFYSASSSLIELGYIINCA